MFQDAIEYPTKSDDLGRRYLIGSLLAIGSLLIIPAFFLLGYFVKAANETLKGEDQLPEFDDFSKLFVDGLKLTGIMMVYFIVPLIPISLLNTVFKSTSMEPMTATFNMILLAAALYLLPAAIVNFARDGRMRDAFRIREIVQKAYTSRYFKGVLILAGTSILIGLVEIAAVFLLAITIIGIPALLVVIPAMQFYENLVYFRMMAKMTE